MNSLGEPHDPRKIDTIITTDATLEAYKAKHMSKKHKDLEEAKQTTTQISKTSQLISD